VSLYDSEAIGAHSPPTGRAADWLCFACPVRRIGFVFHATPIFGPKTQVIGFVWRNPARQRVAAASASLPMVKPPVPTVVTPRRLQIGFVWRNRPLVPVWISRHPAA